MGKKRSMITRKKNYDASSRKRINTCDHRGGVPWSDLNHDVLYSIMMRLGVVEFLSFSKVCKSWRSLALANRKRFMASKPPMAMLVSENTCYLQDFEEKEFKNILPHSTNRTCIGVTCGYLILFGKETRDFSLVNIITMHELHFPNAPLDVVHPQDSSEMRAILVFSPSIDGWVFFILNRFQCKIWFSIAGKGAWNHVISAFPLLDLHPFKGKIYILSIDYLRFGGIMQEMRLDPVPKLTLFDACVLEPLFLAFNFISSDDNLYLIEYWPKDHHEVHKLDFDQLNWARCEKTMEEYALFYSILNHGVAVKPESWAAPSSQYRRFFGYDGVGINSCVRSNLWYFPHDCLNVTIIDE